MDNITLELTVQEINTILGALGEIPAKVSMEVIAKIQKQAQGQMVPPSEEG